MLWVEITFPSFRDAHAWWNYKENLCLINFSLPLIYDFSLCCRLSKTEGSFWGLFFVCFGFETNIPLKRFATRETSDFDPQKYVTNFIRANRFTINPSLMLPIKSLAWAFKLFRLSEKLLSKVFLCVIWQIYGEEALSVPPLDTVKPNEDFGM